jgi:hypothetical protein
LEDVEEDNADNDLNEKDNDKETIDKDELEGVEEDNEDNDPNESSDEEMVIVEMLATPDEEDVEDSDGNVKVIPSDYFPVDDRLTFQHGRDALASENKAHDECVVTIKYKQMKIILKNVNEMASIANEQVFSKRQDERGFLLVQKLQNQSSVLRNCNAHSGRMVLLRTSPRCSRLFKVKITGVKPWARSSERAYFANRKLAYPDETDEKGCIERLFYKERQQL